MKRIGVVLVALFTLAFCALPMLAFAGDVPGVTVADFESPQASAIWSILAGQGPWGVLLFGLLGLVWKFAKPYLDEWAAARKLDRLLAVVEMAVVSSKQTFVDAIKAASADGKLTEEEAKNAKTLALNAAIAIGKTQGMDIVKEYGMDVLNWAIEYIVGKMGLENKALKAVSVPLSDLVPLPPSVTSGMRPA